ncbi:MAG: hypothetical protein C4542_03060 [Dehalococcoidia bacterium]|nr:MAG: hypothetical protein C4542_03060 [Dehalococcoidia bacterium]
MDAPRFMADQNVGKLARLLRMLGFDTLFFDGRDDGEMVQLALEQGRIILTRNTRIMQRKLVTSGRLKAVLLVSDRPEEQVCHVIKSLRLKDSFCPFTLCIEDNHPLELRGKEEVKDRVPPYVFQTQAQYMECPHCKRIYWRGTHWQAMTGRIDKL